MRTLYATGVLGNGRRRRVAVGRCDVDAGAGVRVAAFAAARQIADLCHFHGQSPTAGSQLGRRRQAGRGDESSPCGSGKEAGKRRAGRRAVAQPPGNAALLEKAGPEAPVLAINVENFALTRVAAPILDAGRPLAVFSLPASGHDWMYAPRWLRQGHRVALLASSDYDELERALRLLRVIPMMRRTKILLFPPARGTKPACSPEEVKKRLGADVVAFQQQDLDEMLAAVDGEAVRAEVDAWTKGAKADPRTDERRHRESGPCERRPGPPHRAAAGRRIGRRNVHGMAAARVSLPGVRAAARSRRAGGL